MPNHSIPTHESSREPLAIIGIGCRFPGDVSDPASFWKLLRNGVDAISEIPGDRWNIEAYYHPTPGVPGKTYTRWGGFIQGVDQFEPECFGISPREAAYMDPQQRLLLEVAWEALEDAGQVPERLVGTSTGVFVGISTSDYAHIQINPFAVSTVEAYTATGGALSIAANRISHCLNLQGPSIAVDTACSSSLVATHLACRSLWERECDVALVGGVNVIITPEHFLAFCAASMLSPDGRCKAFDASANGFVRSEGAGVIVLKPLSQALADGDPVYALIAGSAVNQDGRTAGIAAPSQAAQEALLRAACQHAGVAPCDIQYLEAHGTGTPVGDPIEACALGAVLSINRPAETSCLIGSVKTNIGHMEAAAGVAGIIKTALVLQHRMIPPNLHFHHPNPQIPFADLQLRVPCALEPWPEAAEPALAGVNSFGFGGTNAHVVMMAYPGKTTPPAALPSNDTTVARLFPLSARTPEALRELSRSYRAFLCPDDVHHPAAFTDLCYTVSVRRAHLEHRLALVVHNRDDLLAGLDAFLAGESRAGMASGRRVHGQTPKIAFVFAGQGPQWWGMGRELLVHEPVFRTFIERCDGLLRQHADWSLLGALSADESRSRLQETAIAQPALFALQVALAALWKSWGVEPAAVVGHSVGEIAAAHIAGALSLDDAVRVIVHRGRCMDLASSQGRMLAVGLTMAAAQEAIEGYEDTVSLAAINSPSSATLSGDPHVLEQIAQSLERQGIFCRFLSVNYAFHSPQMDPVRDGLLTALDGLVPEVPTLPMVSTVTGELVESRQCDAWYWWQNVRQSVRFAQAMERLLSSECDTFVELSPHPVLSAAVTECLLHHGRQGLVLPSLRRQEAERATMLASLGSLYSIGQVVDWQQQGPEGGRCVSLPRYPWQHRSYWHEAAELRQVRLGKPPHPLLGRDIGAADPTWEGCLDRRLLGYLTDHRVQGHAVFPAAAYVEMALVAAGKVLGEGPCSLEEVQFQKALFLSDTEVAPSVQLIVYPPDASFAVHSRTPQTDASWLQHATGYLRRPSELSPPGPVDLAGLRRAAFVERSAQEFYRTLAACGLHYGPTFQGIKQLWSKEAEALGQIKLHDDLVSDVRHYIFHPALLDACSQVLFGALPAHDTANRLYLPVQIERLHIYRASERLAWSHAHLTYWSPKAIVADIRVYNEAGSLLAALEGIRCQAVEGERHDDASNVEGWFYDVRWQSKPRAQQRLVPRPAAYLPATHELVQAIAGEVQPGSHKRSGATGVSTPVTPLDILAQAYLGQAMAALGWRCQPGACLSVDTLMQQWQLEPSAQPRLRWFMRLLEKAGYLVRLDPELWEVSHLPAPGDPDACWRRAWLHDAALFAELNALTRCGTHLAAVLRGTVEPEELLLPQPSDTLAEHLYQDAPTFAPGNYLLQRVMREMLRRLPGDRMVRILEVGAGVGGMTTYVLPTVPADRTTYVLAEAAPLLRARAEQRLRDYPFLHVQALDLGTDPVLQGYAPHTFDFILASGRLPVPQAGRAALKNILKLLSPNGVFLFLGLETTALWLELLCGMLQAWWSADAECLLPGEVLHTRQRWQSVLQEAGFTQVEALPVTPLAGPSAQVLMLARSPSGQPAVQPGEPGLSAPLLGAQHGTWLVFADSSGVAQRVVEGLRAGGGVCLQVTPGDAFRQLDAEHFTISPQRPEDMESLLHIVTASEVPPWRGVIHLWSLDIPPPSQTSLVTLQHAEALGCHCVMHLVQGLHRLPHPNGMPRLILVTRNAQPVGNPSDSLAVGQSLLLGLGRTLLNEHPELRCKMVDLGPDLEAPEIASLLAELQTDDVEEEIALRHGERFAPRLERWSQGNIVVHQVGDEPTPFRLVLPPSNVIDRLNFHATSRRPPGPGQVEIEVEAAALNFRDVMKALGLYPTDNDQDLMLGDECAGRIVALGDGVEAFTLGDPVLAVALGSLGTHVTTLAELVIPRPAQVTGPAAAGLPIVFLTAYYALHHLARLQAGERVLIHAAAGGVGLAAVQLAQHAGAEIFATAGSPGKRQLLTRLGVQHVFDSRSVTFADHIREITHGHGVDIVLNALAGEAIVRGIACLAPYGRFLELGKRDIYQNSKLGLRALRKNVSFFTIDLGALLVEKPALAQALLAELSQRLNATHFRPLPYRVFPTWRIVEAFQHMAQARHMGKIVISMQDHHVSIAPPEQDAVAFRPDATYLVTGGCGGFGLAVARWIIERGGRHLVLMGRHGAASAESQRTLEALQQTGAHVVVALADVTEEQQLAAVLADVDHSMPPLRGVFHAAAYIDDSLVLRLDAERFRQVTAPKVHGAWNLHTQTRDRTLDHFVLFSSVSALIGNPGQGNYVAANTFLDAFATYRRSLGLPATTINWGHLTEVGYVARHQEISQALTRLGVLGFAPSQALEALGRLLQHKPVQMAVIHMDWPQWARSMPQQRLPQRLSSLVSLTPQAFAGDETAHLRHLLQGATPQERQEIVQTYIRDQVARVLGATAGKLDVERPLNEFGLDSLMAVQLKNRLENGLGLTLPISELLRSPSITRLQTVVLEQLALPVSSTVLPPLIRQDSTAQALAHVEQLSDEEVDALLQQMQTTDGQAAGEAAEEESHA